MTFNEDDDKWIISVWTDDSESMFTVVVTLETINFDRPVLTQAWPPHPRVWNIRWSSCPITATPSACWLPCLLRRTHPCPTSSRTSTQPRCRAGPKWCTWEKSACSSQSKTQTCNLLLKPTRRCECNVGIVFRFTADAEVDLKETLSALGITDMFSVERADFRHLSE